MMKNNINDHIDFSLPSNQDATTTPKEKLYNTFIYSLSILYSRCHGSRDEGEIIPIVELFNGHSDKIDEAIESYDKSLMENYSDDANKRQKKMKKLKAENERKSYLNPEEGLAAKVR